MQVTCKKVETIAEFIDAIRIRVDVFIKEQGFKPGWEPDEVEKEATHFIAMSNGEIIATARYREISKGDFKIERVATRKEFRGKGISSKLLKFMVHEAQKNNASKIWSQAQEKVKGFYEKNGFTAVSKEYELHDVKHVDMLYK